MADGLPDCVPLWRDFTDKLLKPLAWPSFWQGVLFGRECNGASPHAAPVALRLAQPMEGGPSLLPLTPGSSSTMLPLTHDTVQGAAQLAEEHKYFLAACLAIALLLALAVRLRGAPARLSRGGQHMTLNDEGGGMRTTSGGSGGGLARFLPWGSAPGGSSGPVGIMEAGLLPKPVQAPPPKYWLEARKEDAEVSEPARKAAVPLQKRRSHDTSGSPAQELAAAEAAAEAAAAPRKAAEEEEAALKQAQMYEVRRTCPRRGSPPPSSLHSPRIVSDAGESEGGGGDTARRLAAGHGDATKPPVVFDALVIEAVASVPTAGGRQGVAGYLDGRFGAGPGGVRRPIRG